MEIIKLTEEQIKMIEATIEYNKDMQVGYNQACAGLKRAKKQLWNKIYEIFPEYKNHEMDFHLKNNELIVSYKKEE